MIGRTVSHYVVTGKLGVGGMGVVYEARDTRLSRPVALKFFPDDLAEAPDSGLRLLREAETSALLNHPNICTIYEIDHDDGDTFIVMERLDGLNLRAHLAQGRLETAQLVDITRQVTDALAYAHGQGVVHRDIKPGNVFVCSDGRVKVLDFGLSRRFMVPDTGRKLDGGSTVYGRPVGTANYMAPERILQLPLDPRSDLFSLGVLMYEMATGKLPFAAPSPADIVTNVLERDPVPITTVSPDRPGSLQRVVAKLLAKQADERYQSAADLRQALDKIGTRPGFFARLFNR
jgi:serine/threonine protein kinase